MSTERDVMLVLFKSSGAAGGEGARVDDNEVGLLPRLLMTVMVLLTLDREMEQRFI